MVYRRELTVIRWKTARDTGRAESLFDYSIFFSLKEKKKQTGSNTGENTTFQTPRQSLLKMKAVNIYLTAFTL